MVRWFRSAAALLAAAVVLGAAPPAHDWSGTVAQVPRGGHLIGNPAARLKLTEYVSYTCPHCAHFQEQSAATLRDAYVRPGKVSVEVRHIVRDPIDLAAALMTNCGAPAKFPGNHDLFLLTQTKWIATLEKSTEAQRQRWGTGQPVQRLRTIAHDFGFYAMMATRGYGAAQLDACIASKPAQERLIAMTRDSGALGVESTPNFLLDGVLLGGVYDWAALEAQLKARLAA